MAQVGRQVADLVLAAPIAPDPEVLAAYATAVVRTVAGGQRGAGQLAVSFIGAYVPPVVRVDLDRALLGLLVRPGDPVASAGLELLSSLIADGVREAEAREAAAAHASGLAQSQLNAANRAGLDEAVRASGREPRGWRLEASDGACEWCQFIAGTGERYLSAASVPVPHAPDNEHHPGGACSCSPAPEF